MHGSGTLGHGGDLRRHGVKLLGQMGGAYAAAVISTMLLVAETKGPEAERAGTIPSRMEGLNTEPEFEINEHQELYAS